MDAIKLYLGGEKIETTKFKKSISAFYGLLDQVSMEMINKDAGDWIVSVAKGSIALTHDPISDQAYSVIQGVGEGMAMLEREAVRPQYFNDKALEFARSLALIAANDNGLSKVDIVIGNVQHHITKHTAANIDEILDVSWKDLGSIEGKLSTISERKGFKVIVYERLTDRAIKCHINNDELQSEITSAFGKRVYVYGLISYGKDKFPKSINVEGFKVFPDKNTLPTASTVCGILAG